MRAVVQPGGRPILAVLVAVGVALRLWSGAIAAIHDDELHYAADAAWARSPLDFTARLHFLRDHPRDHLRLDLRTGTLEPWGQRPGDIARLGHPCLVQMVGGLVAWVVAPQSEASAVMTARAVNALVDASTIALLPPLVSALGGSGVAGLLAAGLYAVFPPAVTYGALAYLDPPLAPLLVLLLLTALDRRPGMGRWVRSGIVTGLLIGTKQVGLLALVLVPVAGAVLSPRSLRGLAVWAATSALVVMLFTNPAAYLDVLRHPSRPIGQLAFEPVAYTTGNIEFWARPATYYWLSFARHGRPLAPLLARVHMVLTPAYLVAYGGELVTALAGGAGRRLVALYLPALVTLAWSVPSDGLWRLHILSPLVCAGAALFVTSVSRRWRALVLGLAVLAGGNAVLPQRLAADGQVDLGDLLFANPQAPQKAHVHSAVLPLTAVLGPGVALSRLVWLRPGSYEVAVAASTTASITIDGQAVPQDGPTAGELGVDGYVHRLRLALPAGGMLRSVSIRRRAGSP